MFKKGDFVIYEVCGEKRQVKIVSDKIILAYNNGAGYKIKLPDGKRIYVSEKNLYVRNTKI